MSSRTHPSPSPDSDISALSSAGSFVHVAPNPQSQASSSSRHNTATDLDGDDEVHASRWWAGVVEDKRMEVREQVKILQTSLENGKLTEAERHVSAFSGVALTLVFSTADRIPTSRTRRPCPSSTGLLHCQLGGGRRSTR